MANKDCRVVDLAYYLIKDVKNSHHDGSCKSRYSNKWANYQAYTV